MMICSIPDATASSTAYWMIGRSTSGIISLGMAFVAGRNRVPKPAAGRTAFRTRTVMGRLLVCVISSARPWRPRRCAAGSRARVLTGDASIPDRTLQSPLRPGPDGTIAPPMLKSLVRTFRGPSRDPRMAYISRPLPARPPGRAGPRGPRGRPRRRPESCLPGRDAAVRTEAGHRPRPPGDGPIRPRRHRRLRQGAGHDPRRRCRRLARLRRHVVPAARAVRQGRGDPRSHRCRRCRRRGGCRGCRPEAGLGAASTGRAAARDGPPERPARSVARAGIRVPALRRADLRSRPCTPGARRRRTRSSSFSTAQTAATGSRSTTSDVASGPAIR